MKYSFYNETFTWDEVEAILESRVEGWAKQIRIARKVGMDQESLKIMKYLLGVYLNNYWTFRIMVLGKLEMTETRRIAEELLEYEKQ